KLQMRAFGVQLHDVFRLRGKRDDGVDDRGGLPEVSRIVAHFLFPRLAIDGERNPRPRVGLRLFARKIRRAALLGLYVHFLAGLYLDQRFGGGAVLFVGFQPDRAAQHLGIVVERGIDAGAAVWRRSAIDLVSVIEFVAAGAHRNFQPTIPCLIAAQKSSVGTRDRGAL